VNELLSAAITNARIAHSAERESGSLDWLSLLSY